MKDEELEKTVMDELNWEPSVNASGVTQVSNQRTGI
jgi:hypothetical protein